MSEMLSVYLGRCGTVPPAGAIAAEPKTRDMPSASSALPVTSRVWRRPGFVFCAQPHTPAGERCGPALQWARASLFKSR
jgi:hypothetical protein